MRKETVVRIGQVDGIIGVDTVDIAVNILDGEVHIFDDEEMSFDVGFTPDDARDLAKILQKAAKEAER